MLEVKPDGPLQAAERAYSSRISDVDHAWIAAPATRPLTPQAPATAPTPSEQAVGGREAALGSHEELSTPERIPDPRRGCPRWPAGLLLCWKSGELTGYVEGRCGAVNKCGYCAIQTAHENAKMLSIEAAEGNAPTILLVLGTRTPTTDPRPFYRGREKVMRALRRRFGRHVEYASILEFTTGLGRRSGGLRRPHWNVFLKGIESSQLDEASEIIRRVWCAHVDADPDVQYVAEIRDAASTAKYVALHFQKESQAPPPGWSGQRFNSSRGFYTGRSRAEMRALARAELRRDRQRWKVRQQAPELDDETVQDLAEQLLWHRDTWRWALKSTSPAHADELLGRQRLERPPKPPRPPALLTSSAL